MSFRTWIPALVCALAACGQPSSPDSPPGAESPGSEELSSLADTVRSAAPAFQKAGEPRSPGHVQIRLWIRDGESERALLALTPLSVSDTTGEAAFLAGWTLYGQDLYALALPHLVRAIEGGPGYPQAEFAFFLAGRCLQERGQLEDASAAFEADMVLRPNSGDGRFRLAQLVLEQGDVDRCETLAKAALERYSKPRDQAKVHALIADIHLARDQPDQARESLERCVQLFPHYEAFYRLSLLCRQAGDTQAADAYLAQHQKWRKQAGQ